jgi:polyhydroxybutyrate depolymerase
MAKSPSGQAAAAGSAPAHGIARAAAIAAIAAPAVWALVAALEVFHANIGHSITSRPERFFSDSAWHWPIVALVVAMVGCQLAAMVALAWMPPRTSGSPRSPRDPQSPRSPRDPQSPRSPRDPQSPRDPRSARDLTATMAAAALVVAAIARVGLALLLPSDPRGYSIGAEAALAADVVIVAAILSLVLGMGLSRRAGPATAWITSGLAIAAIWAAAWATVWAARSGASQPQLLAVEPAEFLLSVWAGAIGLRLLLQGGGAGWTANLRIPNPGAKATAALALVAIAAVAAASGSFVNAYRPTIGAQIDGRTQVERIHADAVDRTYRVYRPTTRLAKPGLVIVLHGSFGGGFQIETDSGFDAQADRLGWVAAYPDGVADGWDAFGSTDKWGKHPGADDVAFISNLIGRLEATDGVDPDRVYVTGLSRGGMMSYRLGCALSAQIAAIAPVSGNMATASGGADVPCTLSRPVSVFAIHGTADGMIPIDGGKVDITFSPFADVIARWRSLDGCGTDTATATDGPSTTTTWTCASGSTVSQRIVTGGWHTWPRVSGALASNGGLPDSFDAARLITDFFVAHPRKATAG